MIDTIEITKLEYYSLLETAERLSRLEAGGVDNWHYYGDAIYGEDNEESMDAWEERTKKEVFGD